MYLGQEASRKTFLSGENISRLKNSCLTLELNDLQYPFSQGLPGSIIDLRLLNNWAVGSG